MLLGTQILLSLVIANFCIKFFYGVELRSGLVRQDYPERPIDTMDDIDIWQNQLFLSYSGQTITIHLKASLTLRTLFYPLLHDTIIICKRQL